MKYRLVGAGLLLAGVARAQSIDVTVKPGAQLLAPADDVRRALREQLHGAAVNGVLTIAPGGAGRVVLGWRDADGKQIGRTVTVTGDRTTIVQTLALIAANLVRNEADEILAELTPPRSTVAGPAAPVVIEPTTGVPLAPSSPGGRRELSSRAVVHPLAIGAEAYLSQRSAEMTSPMSGLFVDYAVASHLALGLGNVILAPVGGQMALSIGPFVEVFSFMGERVQLFAQAGAPLQAHWGSVARSGFGALPYIGAGPRLWGGDFSVGAAVRVAVVATDSWVAPPTSTSRGTVSVSGGLEVALHP